MTTSINGRELASSALYGKLYNDSIVPIKIDETTQNVEIIKHTHAEIHAGDHYNYSDYALDQASAVEIEFVFTTPDTAKWAHLILESYSSEGSTIELYEGTSGITGGTSITPRNNDRNSSNASGIILIKDPTSITSDGVRAAGFLAGGGRTAGFQKRDNEFILKQNESYLVRITSLATGNDISWGAEWYEHKNAA